MGKGDVVYQSRTLQRCNNICNTHRETPCKNKWAGARTAQGTFGNGSLYFDDISCIGSLCRSKGGWTRDEKQDNTTGCVVGFCR
jgi:hypothetical protein